MRWLTAQTTQQTILLAALFLLMAVATILLACGPVAQPAPADDVALPTVQDGGGSEEPTAEPTVELTDTPRPTNSYPKLTASLQDVVRKYESGELSETEAAALILAHHGAMVLVQVDASANIDTIDNWMAEQEITPRHKNASFVPPHIYAYVKVSLLGSLSQQDSVTAVKSPSDQFTPDELLPNPLGGELSSPSGASGQSDSGEPISPRWLKGYPYPRLDNKLESVIYRYENGKLTEAEAAREFDHYQGSTVLVEVELLANVDTADIVAWLKSNGVTPTDVYNGKEFPGEIKAYVPISLLGALSQHLGVHEVNTPIKPISG